MPQQLYRTDLSLPYWFVRGRATSINVSISDDATGEAAAPTAATFTLTEPDGTEAVSAQPATSIVGGFVSFLVPLANVPLATELSSRWVALWKVTIGGVEYDFENPAHIVRREPLAPVTVGELQLRHQVLATLRTRDKTNQQLLRDSIRVAFEDLLRRLVASGRDPGRVMAGGGVFNFVAWSAMAHAFLDAASSLNSTGQLGELGAFYDRKAEKAWASLKIDYDKNGDGLIANDEQNQSGQPVLFAGVKRWIR